MVKHGSNSRGNAKRRSDEPEIGVVYLVDCGSFRCAAVLDPKKVWHNRFTGEEVKVVRVLGRISDP